ncbi:hypothetical protein, partial [Cryobacterium frigoriphilum]|uniref:hypothetical protein n=1 Tax=Cryobacterium frigoriphilum TaxID=1259150 RepID=UPI001A7E4CE9
GFRGIRCLERMTAPETGERYGHYGSGHPFRARSSCGPAAARELRHCAGTAPRGSGASAASNG